MYLLHLRYIVFVYFQIAHFKIPRYIKFIDEFPLTVTGKVRILMFRPSTFLQNFSKVNLAGLLFFISSESVMLGDCGVNDNHQVKIVHLFFDNLKLLNWVVSSGVLLQRTTVHGC